MTEIKTVLLFTATYAGIGWLLVNEFNEDWTPKRKGWKK